MNQNAKNAVYTKEYNRAQILRLLRRAPVSRAELSRETGLTRAAISLIVEELIREGLVRESSAAADGHSRGRMPVLLKLCPDGAYAVGIWLGRSGCRVGICDLAGKVICQEKLPLQSTANALMEPLAKTVEALISRQGIHKQRILGVGISAPGPLDPDKGVILNPPGFDAFHHFAIADALAGLLQLPVYLEKDANGAAVCHYMDGACGENSLLLIVDSGVGSGVIHQGKLLRGCELGHTAIDFQGQVCACGNRGCLELYASTPRLLRQFPADSWEALMASSQAEAALELEADYLSAAILNLNNILPLDTVLFSGDLQPYCQSLVPRIRQRIQGKSLGTGKLALLPATQNETSRISEACAPVFGRYLHIC